MTYYTKPYDPSIHIPVMTSNYVTRTRLKELAMEKRTIILQADAGMGKTIFLTAAAHHFEGKCVWCDLEAAGNTMAGFVALLESAIKVVEPGFSFGITSDKPEPMVRDIAFHMIHSLNRLADEPILFIMDNAQEFTNDSAESLFSVLFRGLHPNIRIMIATKGEFPIALAPYQAKGIVSVIDREMLCFRSCEIAELLHKMTDISGQDRLVQEILDYTEGWPLAVMLIAMRLQQLGYAILGDRMVREGHKELSLSNLLKDMQMYQYIASEVFGKLEPSLQRFLLMTSVLDDIEPSVCSYVTKQTNAHQILEQLAANNLFISRVTGEKEWYRYHSVLLDFLRDRLSREQTVDIWEKAAAYYMSGYHFSRGTSYAVRAGSAEIIARALENYGSQLLQNGQLEILGEWANYLTQNGWKGKKAALSVRGSYLLSRYFLYTGRENESISYLAEACKAALRENGTRLFSHYFYDLHEDLEKLQLITLKWRILQVFMDAEVPAKEWLKDKYSRSLLKEWTEYALCLNEYEQISAFYYDAMQYSGYRGSELCDMHAGILKVLQKKLTGEELLTAARSIRTYSDLLSDFGFFTYINDAYRNEQYERIIDAATELTDSRDNCFRAKSRIYRILIQYEKGLAETEDLRQDYQYAQRILQEQNQPLPFLRPQDKKALLQLQNGIAKKHPAEPKAQGAAALEKTEQHESQLKILCMDGLQVISAEGTPLTWRTKKAKELFFRLFLLQGRGCDKQTLMEELWPEGESDKTSALFDTTISYLKKSLKTAEVGGILVSNKRTYSLDMSLITSDYNELSRLLTRYEKQEWLQVENPSLIKSLYRQGLMKGEDYEWAIFEREHLERRVMNALTILAGHFFMTGAYADSIETAHFALEINPYNESLVRLLVDSYVSNGQIGRAKKMQTHYRKLWAEEIGETLEFAEILIG